MPVTAKGYAILNRDREIVVASVSPTPRAAIVNWLVTIGHYLFASDTDEDIADIFESASVETMALLIEVEITGGAPIMWHPGSARAGK